MIRVLSGLVIPDEELEFSASRSGGPGGQNVNKVNTRVTIRFDVTGSRVLSADQKRRILTRLATRASGEGVVRVVSRQTRSQAVNRAAAEERLAELLRGALASPKLRKKLAVPEVKKRNRLEAKRHHSLIKQDRNWRSSREG